MKKRIPLLAAWVLVLLGGYCYIAFLLPLDLPPLPSSTVFLDNKGQEIGEIVYSGSIRHRESAPEEIPEFYKTSLIALEDKTFWTNNGISVRWIVRSMLRNIRTGRIVEWGTTLSSGLVRNALWIREDRTAGKKIMEFLYAIRLNRLYSKDAILAAYINRVDFGYLNYGLASAARYYFNRDMKDLTKAEQIALLILPKDTKKYDPYKKPKGFRSRFEKIVSVLGDRNILTQQEQNDILNESLRWNTQHGNTLPYVADFLKTLQDSELPKEGGGKMETSFSKDLSEQIDTIAKNTLSELAWRNVSDYGIIIAERANISPLIKGDRGDFSNPLLRVMIGGANYTESVAGQVNSTLALRQPGSTVKPFTYLLAFEKLGLTPESTVLDLPTAYKTSENYAYEPKNYSQDYKGEITLRQALSESVNIPAVKLAERVGVPVLLDFLRKVGVTSLRESAEHYGLWLTLGNGEMSLLELLQSYTVFANDGVYCPFYLTPTLSTSGEGESGTNDKIPPTPLYQGGNNISPRPLGEGLGVRAGEGLEAKSCKQVADPKYTDMVVSILTDRYAKLGGFPLYSALDFPDRNVFVKTGTSRNFRDNWAVGFTDRYMIGVWTGNKSGEDMKGVSGATGAGEIFRRIVYALETSAQEHSPKKAQADTQPYLVITNPLESSLYRKESGKTGATEKIRLRFETDIPHDTVSWILDGVRSDTEFIDPVPGNHTVEAVLIKDGSVVAREKSTFRVEGAR